MKELIQTTMIQNWWLFKILLKREMVKLTSGGWVCGFCHRILHGRANNNEKKTFEFKLTKVWRQPKWFWTAQIVGEMHDLARLFLLSEMIAVMMISDEGNEFVMQIGWINAVL